MKYRFFISLFILFASVEVLHSQKDTTTEIDKIKLSNKYISATGSSMKSSEDASEQGKLLLADDIRRWLEDNVKGDITGYVTKSKEKVAVIETRRGKLYRSFIYVKKSDILPYYKDEEVITDTPQSEDASQVVDTSQCKYVEPTSPSVSPVADKPSVGNKNQNRASTITEEESKMLQILNTTECNQYLEELMNGGHLEVWDIHRGIQKAWPERGRVYVFFYNSDKLVKDRVKITDGVAVDLSTGASVDIQSIRKKYLRGWYVWFILK